MITPKRLLAASILFGVAIAALTFGVASNGTPLGNEASWQREVQTWDWFGPIASVVNFAGNYNTWIMFLAPLPAWLLSKALPDRKECTELLWLSVLLAFFAGANPILKEIIESPRPSAEYGIEIDRVRDSFGFPSGHVSSDILFFGSIAGFAWRIAPRRVAIALAVIAGTIIVLAGPARIHSGAHWPTDTLGGYLLGAALLCLAWAIFLATIGPLQVPKPTPSAPIATSPKKRARK